MCFQCGDGTVLFPELERIVMDNERKYYQNETISTDIGRVDEIGD